MVLDVAHSSEALLDDLLRFSERPLLSSHTGVRGTCNNTRNLSDRHIEGIALSGGLISIAYFDQAICGTSLKHIVDAIVYVRDIVGIEHVSLGSDFDGTTVTAFDASKLALITQSLLEEGSFSTTDVARVMGGNAVRVLGQLLPDE